MESGVTVRSFNKRSKRKYKNKQPYFNMAAQTKEHVSRITQDRKALLDRAIPESVSKYYSDVNYLELCRKQTAHEWNRLVNLAEFRKTANIEWLIDYNNFLNDLGQAPSPQHVVVKEKHHVKFTKYTCKWEPR